MTPIDGRQADLPNFTNSTHPIKRLNGAFIVGFERNSVRTSGLLWIVFMMYLIQFNLG